MQLSVLNVRDTFFRGDMPTRCTFFWRLSAVEQAFYLNPRVMYWPSPHAEKEEEPYVC